jgi:hypothetical protein
LHLVTGGGVERAPGHRRGHLGGASSHQTHLRRIVQVQHQPVAAAGEHAGTEPTERVVADQQGHTGRRCGEQGVETRMGVHTRRPFQLASQRGEAVDDHVPSPRAVGPPGP